MSDINVQKVVDNLSEQIRRLIVENAILKAQVETYELQTAELTPES